MQTMPNRLTDIYINQGTDYEEAFPITGVDDYIYYGCIRKHQDTDAFMEFIINTDADNVIISLPASVTIDMQPKTYIYELMKKNKADGKATIVVEGNAIVDQGIEFKEPVSSGDIIIDGGTF